ncbi:MAG: hypothetical protein M1831_003989 [Alyxoria varia]|nr:MAG: hypothetical protein M1831_003989 [Alyxoria varia]
MGIRTRRSPLPAPTESSIDNASALDNENTDIATDLSRRTDRTSYSVPEDGEPLTLPTKNIRTERSTVPGDKSQTSLLIEYYEGNKSSEHDNSKPSIRVKVTPHAKKLQEREDIKITEVGREKNQPVARRIGLGSRFDTKERDSTSFNQTPVEVQIMQDKSDISSEPGPMPAYLPPGSDISSMPADSTLEGPPKIKSPERAKSPTHEQDSVEASSAPNESLKAPPLGRSRSKSTERITRKAVEKLTREQSPDSYAERRKLRGKSKEAVEDDVKGRSRRSSKSHSATESSLLPPRDGESNVSGASKVSINNPRLIQLVEDTIKRTIMPELEGIRRQQSVRSSYTRESFTSESSASQADRKRHSHRSSTSKPKVVVNRDEDDIGVSGGSGRRRKHRRSSRSSDGSEIASSRRSSVDSIAQEKERIRKRKEAGRSSKDVTSAEENKSELTKANLKSHDSRSSMDSHESKDRQGKNHTKTRRRGGTETTTKDTLSPTKGVPPMPMNSEIQDSELTRESILSAETAGTDQNDPSSHPGGASVKEVSRGSPRTFEPTRSRDSPKPSASSRGDTATPRGVRSREEVRSATPRSDRSSSSKQKSAALAAAGLGGAAAAMYGHGKMRDSEKRPRSKGSGRSRSGEMTPTRSSSRQLREDQSGQSTPSMDYPLTQKRHQGVNLEETQDAVVQEGEGTDNLDLPEEDAERFYEEQHELNDQYRSSGDFDHLQVDRELSTKQYEKSPNDSGDSPSFGKVAAGQEVRGLGANPEIVDTPLQAESAVASLVGPSVASSQSVQSGNYGLSHKPDVESLGDTREMQQGTTDITFPNSPLAEYENPSAERWNALRDQAEQLSNGSKDSTGNNSPQRALAQSEKSDEQVQMGTSGMPVQYDPIPEIGHGLDDGSDDITNPSIHRKDSSVLEGPLGDEYENRDHWPYEPTPPGKRDGYIAPDEHDEHVLSAGNAALMGAAAGLGIDRAAQAQRSPSPPQPSLRQERSVSSADRFEYGRVPDGAHLATQSRKEFSPAHLNDEGYISAAQPKSPDDGSPLSFSKPPPRLFDDSGIDSSVPGVDPFTDSKHERLLSGNSHGMPAEGYDAAMGQGINNIQSRDIVALMDHLTVRDGHRNARDTEILVTLVRSATEMRESFEEMKKFIETQNKHSINQSEHHADRTVNKILNGPRPPTTSASPRMGRSTTTNESDDTSSKKKNIFKRALSGLNSKNDKDLSRIQDMLMQLLEEVEGLKDTQAGSQRGQNTQQPSLDSYERLRAAPESGYEPEGQAGTSSTPNHSGNLSSPPSRSAQRMHSGYDTRRDSARRISTVPEGDEEFEDDPRYQNDDGLLTPTQERPRGAFQDTPKQHQNNQLTPTTPKNSDEKSRQKSSSSSMFAGIPKISRWSKTTTSSAPAERASYQKDRPYSEAFDRSVSEVDVFGPEEVPYSPGRGEDPHRYSDSIEYDEAMPGRSPSPLIPDQFRISAEDPKYRANRHSLTLEHPQPRQGSTHRHQSHLESQAFAYNGPQNRSSNNLSDDGQAEQDAFGSAPSLARFHRSGSNHYQQNNEVSPISSDGAYAANQGPPRPPKVRDDGPLVPPKVPEARRRSMDSNDSSGRKSYDSLEQGRGNQYEREGDGYGSGEVWIEPIPLSRKQSPYSPGGLLAPIEERYSLEQARSTISSPPKERQMNTVQEDLDEDEDDRSSTPKLAPRPAIGATEGPSPRKLTGPREMPGGGNRVASGGSASSIRRKPVG